MHIHGRPHTHTHTHTRWVEAAREGRLAIHGLFRYLWRDNHVPITEVDVSTRQLRTNMSFGSSGVTNDSFWYVHHVSDQSESARVRTFCPACTLRHT
jgi:hypothetical protein